MPGFIAQIQPQSLLLVQEGEKSALVKILGDMASLAAHRMIPPSRFLKRPFYKKLELYFALPVISKISAESAANGIQLYCYLEMSEMYWVIHSTIPKVSTAHELLELQLRLREALKPILTHAEIEEILAVPTRR